jgi:hypothetical protein
MQWRKAHETPWYRCAPTHCHIRIRIARKGIASSERFGRYRWVAERTFAWFQRDHGVTVRYEQRAAIYQAFTPSSVSMPPNGCGMRAIEWPKRTLSAKPRATPASWNMADPFSRDPS